MTTECALLSAEQSPFVVAKFGGTSVADFGSMMNCANIILASPNVRLVVLSASAGVTNLLITLAQGCEKSARQSHLNTLRNIEYAILDKLNNPDTVKIVIDHLLESISDLADAASLATSPELTDKLVSHGELISTHLFAELLRQQHAKTVWFDVRQVMKTDDHFGQAEPTIVQLHNLATLELFPLLEKNIVVTQGFIGQDTHYRTTTLGRGGSDYTAALLAEALHLSRVDIWTDVPGIYTTDPRIEPNAKRINNITFDEAAEMATFGAKILHPATLLPAVRAHIPVFVGSSKSPETGGTLVSHKTESTPQFRALALRRNQTLLTLHSLNMLHARGFLAEIFTILSHHHISVDLITTSEVSIALTLDTTGSTSTQDSLLTHDLLTELSSLCRVEVERDLALVAIIGNALSQVNGLGKHIFGTLDSFHIRMISYGASDHNICLLVPGGDATEIIQTLHHQLFT